MEGGKRVATIVKDLKASALEEPATVATTVNVRPEARERLFDPFFSTKPVGEGRGLGLSFCLSIVRSVGREIRGEREPGKGSTFTALLRPA